MPTKLPRKQKVGFVASGGAAKAACFHMGVALALERKGFRFQTGKKPLKSQGIIKTGREIDVMVGASAGAFTCAMIASGNRVEEIYKAFMRDRNAHFPTLSYGQMLNPNIMDTLLRFIPRLPKSLHVRGFKSIEAFVQAVFCANGFYTTQKLEQFLRREVLPTNQFKDLLPELYIVSTLLDNPGRLICGPHDLSNHAEDPTGQTRYSTDVEISHAAAASMSLPPVFKPYPLRTAEGITYCFDGEVRRTLSTHIAEDAGCDLVIVSYTHQPYRHREDVGSLVDYGIPSIMVQAIYQLIESRIQNFRESQKMKQDVLQKAQKFTQKHKLDRAAADELFHLLTDSLQFKPGIDYIYIHPDEREDDLFFADHFNLSPQSMERIAETGFRSAIRSLKDFHFTFEDPYSEAIAS